MQGVVLKIGRKLRRPGFTLLALILLALVGVFARNELVGKGGALMEDFLFILPESSGPDSLDPLDSDYSNNLHSSQMVHRSILEVQDRNSLSSSVLKTFLYDRSRHQIIFEVNSSERFTDGTPILGSDIEITILRMLAKRPKFPVIRNIVGSDRWTKLDEPLKQKLEGLEVHGDRVVIQFDKDIPNPLYRFALPLFGVVKAECVDRSQNIIRPNCPTSGYYLPKDRGSDFMEFAVRKGFESLSLPKKIRIEYFHSRVTDENLKLIDKTQSTVLFFQQYGSSSEEGARHSELGFHRIEQPNTRFSAFLLNPQTKVFSDKSCRLFFSQILRSELDVGGESNQNEFSLFSRILPGYLSRADLEGSSELNLEERKRCKKILEGQIVRWQLPAHNQSGLFASALGRTAKKLALKIETKSALKSEQAFDMFNRGELDLLLGGSGFWAFDPVGDVQMLFTPGLHKPLSFVTKDEVLQKYLKNLEFDQNPKPKMEALNRYIFDQALLNVYSHSKRVYLVRGDKVSDSIPVAITPPAPWQMFNPNKR